MSVTETVVDVGAVAIENETLSWPAATVTLAGTGAIELLLVRLTTAPPVGAGSVKVTVPVATPPPSRIDGDALIDWIEGTRDTVSTAFRVVS